MFRSLQVSPKIKKGFERWLHSTESQETRVKNKNIPAPCSFTPSQRAHWTLVIVSDTNWRRWLSKKKNIKNKYFYRLKIDVFLRTIRVTNLVSGKINSYSSKLEHNILNSFDYYRLLEDRWRKKDDRLFYSKYSILEKANPLIVQDSRSRNEK